MLCTNNYILCDWFPIFWYSTLNVWMIKPAVVYLNQCQFVMSSSDTNCVHCLLNKFRFSWLMLLIISDEIITHQMLNRGRRTTQNLSLDPFFSLAVIFHMFDILTWILLETHIKRFCKVTLNKNIFWISDVKAVCDLLHNRTASRDSSSVYFCTTVTFHLGSLWKQIYSFLHESHYTSLSEAVQAGTTVEVLRF